jgi:hypothetical protein
VVNESGLPAAAVGAERPVAELERFFAGRGITLSRD